MKYIDGDLLRKEIERLKATNPSEYNYQNAEGYIWALDDIKKFLDTLPEQPVEGLEEEIEMEWDSFNKHLAEYDDGSDEVVWLNLLSFEDIARHFAEWGAEHLKK